MTKAQRPRKRPKTAEEIKEGVRKRIERNPPQKRTQKTPEAPERKPPRAYVWNHVVSEDDSLTNPKEIGTDRSQRYAFKPYDFMRVMFGPHEYIDIRVENGGLEIMSSHGPLVVKPFVSNHLRIEAEGFQ